MLRRLAAIAALAALWTTAAMAQNAICPTMPAGDNSVACASTAYVQSNAVQMPAVLISALPTCNSGSGGTRAVISNGIASPTYQQSVSSTGSTTQPVFCNGSGWIYD